MRDWVKEPLARFVVLGAAIFGLHALVAGPSAGADETPPVVVSDDFLEGLRERHRRRAGTDASDAVLVREHARDEVLYREARRLGLDRADAIVRRRLVQKMEMLIRTTAAPPEPTEAQLAAWLEAHPDDYRAPARVSFEHAWFSRDRRGARALDDARAALAGGAIEGAGDPFPLGARFASRTHEQIAAQLGPAVRDALRDAPIDAWIGPVDGSLGVHLLRVTARDPGGPARLGDVRAELVADWTRARSDRAFDAAVRALVERYGVRRVAEPR